MFGNPPDKDDDMLDLITVSGTAQIDCYGKRELANVGEQEDREMVANLP
jgi:hypothetical protein